LKPEEVLINCGEMFHLISNYVDDAVDPALRARMEKHFRTCRHCTAVLDGTRNVIRLVGDDQTFEVPASFSKKLYAKLDEYLKATQK
jgi:anti-sigma factor RsiW